MSNIKMEVEFLAGTSLEEAIQEAKDKVVQWKICLVTFVFNGCRFSIGINDNSEELVRKYKLGYNQCNSPEFLY
jgi:hypothetical protein